MYRELSLTGAESNVNENFSLEVIPANGSMSSNGNPPGH
jgi:hypothetical protein